MHYYVCLLCARAYTGAMCVRVCGYACMYASVGVCALCLRMGRAYVCMRALACRIIAGSVKWWPAVSSSIDSALKMYPGVNIGTGYVRHISALLA